MQGAKQGVQSASVKRPKLPEGFQGKVYKDKVREGICRVCDQPIEILLVGWQ